MSPDPAIAVLALGAGAASFFAPCVLPVLPGFLAFISGGERSTPVGRMLRTGAFVAGFGVAFVLLGLLVGMAGSATAVRGAETWLGRIGGTLIIVFGLHMTGLLKLPPLHRELSLRSPLGDRLSGRAGTAFGAFGLGGAFAVGWSPCVGPVLASILTVAGVQGGAGEGALLLGLYTVGMGVPFLLVGATGERGTAFLARHGRAARWVERVGGAVLVVLGIFVFTGSLARVTSYLI